jgi:hypothetical protein
MRKLKTESFATPLGARMVGDARSATFKLC